MLLRCRRCWRTAGCWWMEQSPAGGGLPEWQGGGRLQGRHYAQLDQLEAQLLQHHQNWDCRHERRCQGECEYTQNVLLANIHLLLLRFKINIVLLPLKKLNIVLDFLFFIMTVFSCISLIIDISLFDRHFSLLSAPRTSVSITEIEIIYRLSLLNNIKFMIKTNLIIRL